MKKLIVILSIAFFVSTIFLVGQQNAKKEEMKHPRIEKAIHELEDAIEYLEKAPNDFGGYKEQAIIDSRKAVASLKLALKYRAKKDNK
jgi:preprotein translocase subunit SecG